MAEKKQHDQKRPGERMENVGLPGKLADIPLLKEKLFAVFDTKTHRDMASYGLLLAEHILQISGLPLSDALAACLAVNQRWLRERMHFQIARDAAGVVLDLAREEPDPAKQKALRAMAQIANIPHVKRHALIASDYVIKYINTVQPGNMEAVRAERETQIALMESI